MTVTQQQGHVTMNASLVNEQDFHRLVEKRADMLLALLDYLAGCERSARGPDPSPAGRVPVPVDADRGAAGQLRRREELPMVQPPLPDGDDQAVLRRQLRTDAHPAPHCRATGSCPSSGISSPRRTRPWRSPARFSARPSKEMLEPGPRAEPEGPRRRPEIADTFEECQLPGASGPRLRRPPGRHRRRDRHPAGHRVSEPGLGERGRPGRQPGPTRRSTPPGSRPP